MHSHILVFYTSGEEFFNDASNAQLNILFHFLCCMQICLDILFQNLPEIYI